jgi:phosphoenolpyruvate carboxylase
MSNRFRLVTLEQIYEHFDVAHINQLMDYTDKHKRKYNLDNVHIHQPLSEAVVDASDGTEPTLISGDINSYRQQIKLLEARLEQSRIKLMEEEESQPRLEHSNDMWRGRDMNDEIVEVPASLLKQIAEILKNKK